MSRTTYFVQECPTCGRSLQVHVEHLGRQVVCQHCHGRFEACDPSNASTPLRAAGFDLLRRADQLLQAMDQDRPRPTV